MEINNEFRKIITDFTQDLIITYPEFTCNFENINYEEYYDYCKNHYPENFFNILYENNELFDNEETKYLLPNIDFSIIMKDDTLSDSSKKTIWKYLQLILFSVCNNTKNKNEFGDANMLFEAINEDDLSEEQEDRLMELRRIKTQRAMHVEVDEQFQSEMKQADEEIKTLKSQLKIKDPLPKGYIEWLYQCYLNLIKNMLSFNFEEVLCQK